MGGSSSPRAATAAAAAAAASDVAAAAAAAAPTSDECRRSDPAGSIPDAAHSAPRRTIPAVICRASSAAASASATFAAGPAAGARSHRLEATTAAVGACPSRRGEASQRTRDSEWQRKCCCGPMTLLPSPPRPNTPRSRPPAHKLARLPYTDTHTRLRGAVRSQLSSSRAGEARCSSPGARARRRTAERWLSRTAVEWRLVRLRASLTPIGWGALAPPARFVTAERSPILRSAAPWRGARPCLSYGSPPARVEQSARRACGRTNARERSGRWPGADDAEPGDGLAGGEGVAPHQPQPDERPRPAQPGAAVHGDRAVGGGAGGHEALHHVRRRHLRAASS